MKKIISLLSFFVCIFSFTACINPVGGTEQYKKEIDYVNHANGDYSIKVTNETSKKLVAFKGAPSVSNMIGGIPANASNHGLPLKKSVFTTTSDFVLYVVTEDDYLENIDNLAALTDIPYARLYAYYNTNAANNYVYKISSVMGGSGKIVLQNNTDYNIELRKDGPNGETIGYTAARTINTTFYVNPDDYYIFPVFRKYDQTLNEIVTVFPVDEDGDPKVRSAHVDSANPMEINARDFTAGVKFTAGYSYVTIVNSSSDGVSFYDGANSTPVLTSTGGKIINSGKSLTFAIPMELVAADSSTGHYQYAESKSYSQYRIGSVMGGVTNSVYLSGSDSTLFTFEAGKNYIFTVSGSDYKHLNVELTNTDTVSF
ncbi:MAG: hypothetical protein MJ174_00345 [Treponema sp.]|nr:hypothetical protein [Treponema sp.]